MQGALGANNMVGIAQATRQRHSDFKVVLLSLQEIKKGNVVLIWSCTFPKRRIVPAIFSCWLLALEFYLQNKVKVRSKQNFVLKKQTKILVRAKLNLKELYCKQKGAELVQQKNIFTQNYNEN